MPYRFNTRRLNSELGLTASGRVSSVLMTIPFLQSRRRRFVARNAVRLAAFPQAIRRQAKVMARKGISAAVIDRESRTLECAIRAEIGRQVILRPDDGVA
jgi:hypothetical protein